MGNTVKSTKTLKQVKLKPEVKIEWNNRSEIDYLEKGFRLIDLPPGVGFVENKEVKRFLSEVDISKYPIERTVARMFRIRAIDYDSPKQERKQYIYYEEHWNHDLPEWKAKNYLNQTIAPVIAHVEGRWNETMTEDVIVTNYDQSNGTETEQQETQFSGLSVRYYIPFTKLAVDDIISKSAHSDASNIIFMVKTERHDYPTGYGPGLRDYVTYDQFVNWTWDELFRHSVRPLEKATDTSRPIDKSSNRLQFTPS